MSFNKWIDCVPYHNPNIEHFLSPSKVLCNLFGVSHNQVVKNRNCGNRHYCLVLNFVVSHHWNNHYLWVFIDVLYKLDEYPCLQFFEFLNFCFSWMNVEFCQIFFLHLLSSLLFFFFSICCYSKLNWLVLSVEPVLHSRINLTWSW